MVLNPVNEAIAHPALADPGTSLTAAHPLYAVDLDQNITMWDQQAAEQFRSGESLQGRRCYEVLASVDPRNALLCRPNCPVITQARRGQAAQDFEVWAQHSDGLPGRVRVTILLQEDKDPNRSRVIHMVRQVDEREERTAAARGRQTRTLRGRAQQESGSLDARGSLTARQVSALRLLAEGCSPEEIAANLGVRPVTVRNHIQAAMDRLGARSRLEAVIIASRTGLLGALN